MDSFKQNPQKVFPFTVGGCDTIKAGEGCRLDVNDWLPDFYTSGTVKVSETPTSFTFTVHSDYCFVSRGSTITFATYERGGNLYLEQHGEAVEMTPIGDIGYFTGVATAKWKAQSEKLALLLRPDVGPNVHRYISPPSQFERLDHELPVGTL